MKHLFSLVIVSILIGACAKEREIEVLPHNTRSGLIEKASFNGSFLSKVTVVKTSTNSGPMFVGLQSEMKIGHFNITGSDKSKKGMLQFIDDANIYTQPGESSPDRSETLINEWEIEHFDVKLDESDGLIENKETEDKDKHWRDKRYMEIDFANAVISEATTFPYFLSGKSAKCFKPESSHLADDSFKIEADSIQYEVIVDYSVDPDCASMRREVMNDYTYTVHFLYSFVRSESKVSPDYIPYIYQDPFDPLNRKYGFFKTYGEILDPRINRGRSVEFLNRWHPRKTHHYYFAPETPEEFKWIFTHPKLGVIAKTNELFAKHQLPIRFEIHENTHGDGKVKKFGDLRYSFVKFIDFDHYGLLGYGPADAHPLTGEILAANTLIYTQNLKLWLEEMHQKIDYELIPLKHRSLFRVMGKILENSDTASWSGQLSKDAEASQIFRDVLSLSSVTFTHPYASPYTRHQKSAMNPLLSLPIESSINGLKGLHETADIGPLLEELHSAQQGLEMWNQHERELLAHQRNSTLYHLDQHLVDAQEMLASGASPDEVLRSILYQVAIHEFGHNMGLRHNFYGSIDEAHFHAPSPSFDKEGKVRLDSKGQPLLSQSRSSSVMDYMRLEHEANSSHQWGQYDEAALAYAYSAGYHDKTIDLSVALKQNYLYCTDEQVAINFMCNRNDVGSTPSQVVLDKMKVYDSYYQFMNYQSMRQFWDSSRYAMHVIRTFADIKRAYSFSTEALTLNAVNQHLQKTRPEWEQHQIDNIQLKILDDTDLAVKLSMAFFAAVHQQSSADRPWRNEFSGPHLIRRGVALDKIYATYFLMGDTPMMVNPSARRYHSSYLEKASNPYFQRLIDQLMRNNLTIRIDMVPGFISLSRVLYAETATNFDNRSQAHLIDKIRVGKFSMKDFSEYFDLVPEQVFEGKEIVLENIKDFDNQEGEELILERAQYSHRFKELDRVSFILHGDDEVYMVNHDDSPYAADVMKFIREARQRNESRIDYRRDILEMYKLYEKSID